MAAAYTTMEINYNDLGNNTAGISELATEEKLMNLEPPASESIHHHKCQINNNSSEMRKLISPSTVIIDLTNSSSPSSSSSSLAPPPPNSPTELNNLSHFSKCDKYPQKSFDEFDLVLERRSSLPLPDTTSSSSAEINKILDSFNAILDNAEMDYEMHNLQLNDAEARDFIVKSMEDLTNALLESEANEACNVNRKDDCKVEMGDVDENDDLLIIVETQLDPEDNICSSSSSSSIGNEEASCSDSDNNTIETENNASTSSSQYSLNTNTNPELSAKNDNSSESEPDAPDELGSSGFEEGDPEEGYESDRPMMGRPSMRRLKPIQMLPIPSCMSTVTTAGQFPGKMCLANINSESGSSSASSSVSNSPSKTDEKVGISPPGLTTTFNSPTTHMMLVTSLINTVSPSSSSANLMPDENAITNVESGEQQQTNINNASPAGIGPGEMNACQSSTGSRGGSGDSEIVNQNTSTTTTPTATVPLPLSSESNLMGGNLSNSGSNATSNSNNNTTSPMTPIRTTTTVIRHANRTITIPPDNDDENDDDSEENRRRRSRHWPHRLSSVLALLGCTLGLNNICRFSLLSVEYGANFTIQFLILSFIIGIPLFTFHMSIGQYLNAGIIDMWKISPIFQGIGIGLVISQAVIGIYTAVGVSWMFIYFRDSFITKFDQYRWGKCFHDYRGCDPFSNGTSSYAETVPDYFNGVVLQRSVPDYPSSTYFPTSLKFTVAFNLAVVWMLIFVSLSKGLKSYGKVIHGFVLIPIVAVLILASKMVGIVPTDDTGSLFGQTDWTNFFFNSQTWVLAAREAFFTWGILGACIMQITSHNPSNHSLKSDASIVILITTFVLFLSAFIGNACYSILLSQNYTYIPSSFESIRTYQFLAKKTPDFPPNMQFLPSYMHQHTSFLMGVRITKPEGMYDNNPMHSNSVSGYQALRVATELYPATMAVLGSHVLSPFWTVLFYFTFILFGIAQQLAIWHCLIQGITAINAKVLKSWDTTITFFVCAAGFGLGLPLCTELGIFIISFLDYCVGSGWWIMVLYLLELVAVFIVRGAPYCGENIVTVFMTGNGSFTKCFAPFISFVWNVILPVTMLVLSIASFKSGNVRELYDWSFSADGYVFWPSWTRELGSFIQLIPILAVPFVAVIQSCRYLTNGPSDLFDRMQQLYRPHSRGLNGRAFPHGIGNNSGNENSNNNDARIAEDPPPKYTPPPSYSTATSARIAKFLRASLRRSLRRISNPTTTENLPPPPNYASVILEINRSQPNLGNNSDNCCPSSTSALAPTDTATSTSHCSTQVTRMTNASDSLLPILLPITTAMSSTMQASTSKTSKCDSTLANKNLSPSKDNSNTNDVKNIISKAVSNIPLGRREERSTLRRIASDITPSDVARILRAPFQKEYTTDNRNTSEIDFMNVVIAQENNNASTGQDEVGSSTNNGHSYQFSLDRHPSIESDQFYSANSSNHHSGFLSTHNRTSSFPKASNFYNNFVDFSRCSRRSNDSQIGLILDPSRRESLASDILSNEDFSTSCANKMTSLNGIVNLTFQLGDDRIELSSDPTPSTSTAIPSSNITTSSRTSHKSNSKDSNA